MQLLISIISPIFRAVKRFIAFTAKKFYGVFITTFAIIFGIAFGLGASFMGMEEPDTSTDVDYSKIEFNKSETPLKFTYYAGSREGQHKVAHLNLDGIIVEESIASDPFGFFDAGGVISGKDVQNTLTTLTKYQDIQGLFITLNTPGGSPIGSQMISEAIKTYKEQTNKPVFVYVNSLSASGGAWVQASADVVIARNSATLGSVGVVLGFAPQFTNVTQFTPSGIIGQNVEGNINFRGVARGDCKQPNNPLNVSDDYIRNCIDPQLNQIYDLFLDQVSQNQDVSKDRLREIGARTFLAQDSIASEAGFVDIVGNEQVAIDTLTERLNLPANPTILTIKTPSRRTPFEELFGVSLDKVTAAFTNSSQKPYLSICEPYTPLLISGDIDHLTSQMCN